MAAAAAAAAGTTEKLSSRPPLPAAFTARGPDRNQFRTINERGNEG